MGRFLYVTSGDLFLQLTSALVYQIRKFMVRGFAHQYEPSSLWVVLVSLLLLLPISWGFMPPFLGGYLSNFIHPVYRLSTAPVSDETPFAGESPAITASQASCQLSPLRRLVASESPAANFKTES